jgi:hypothetical protein
MDLDSTGYENILIRGMYLGVSKTVIQERIHDVAAFCELEEFLYLPLRTYSAGMKARLAFATATTLINPEILLLDEAIGAGDAAFLEKAKARLLEKISETKILVLASHSDKLLRDLCNKAILLSHGRQVVSGPIDDVLEVYREQLIKSGNGAAIASASRRAAVSDSKVISGLTSRKPALLWANNTGMTSNPGCQAVARGLDKIFAGNFSSQESLPLGYWAASFKPIATMPSQCVKRSPRHFPAWIEGNTGVAHQAWENIRLELVKSDNSFIQKLYACDTFIVNGEGSIHHNLPRALALLAMIKTAKVMEKPVYLLNSTIQAMDRNILSDALDGVKLIHAREPMTYSYLAEMGFDVTLAPDIALLGLGSQKNSSARFFVSPKNCLVTLGVTACKETIESVLIDVRSAGFYPVYFCIGDAKESDIAEDCCSSLHVPLVRACDISLDTLLSFLDQFTFAISGRHHINLFLMKAGIPFVALCSNTWKIEATLKMYGINGNIAHSYEDLTRILEKTNEKVSEFIVRPDRFSKINRSLNDLIEGMM